MDPDYFADGYDNAKEMAVESCGILPLLPLTA